MSTAGHSSAQPRPTVLVANDEPEVLRVLSRTLEREGYRVLSASDGRRAFELACSMDPAIVISDVVMPEMDGVELCRRLKQTAHTASVPILLVSALRKADGDALRGLQAGADDYLEMPYRQQELLVKVARLVERHRLEQHYRDIVEQAADIIYTSDIEGRMTSINEAGARFFGRPASELSGVSLCSLFGAEATGCAALTPAEQASDEPFRSLHYLEDARGAPHYLEAMTTPMRDAQGGRLTGWRGVMRDVTEQKLAEEALRESEEQFRRLSEASLEGIAIHEDGKILEANQALASMGGYVLPEVIGRSILEFVAPESHEQVLRHVSESYEKPYEAIGLRKDGSTFPAELVGRTIRYRGRVVRVTVVRDITERKLAARRLEASRQRYRSLVEYNPDAVYSFDLEGNFLSANPACHQITGYPVEELLQMSFAPLIVPEDLERTLERFRKAAEGEPQNYECAITHRSGRRVELNLTNLPIVVDGEIVGVYGVAKDITERKRAEDALVEQAEREALINRITSAVRRSLDPSEVFRTAVNELGTHLNVDRCMLYTHDREAGRVRNVAEYVAPGIAPAGREFSVPRLAELIESIRRQGVLAFDDVVNDERIRHLYETVLRAVDTRSIMYAAIKVGEETPAAFAISTVRDMRHWRESDIALARAVADQTGIAIRQAELYQRAEATSQREALINRLSQAIRASLNLPEVLRTATHELGRALQASRVFVRPYDPAHVESMVEHEYVAPHTSSIEHLEISYDDPLWKHLRQTQQPVVINDALSYAGGPEEFDENVRAIATRAGIHSLILYPVVVQGRFHSTICIHQTDRVRYWTRDDLALVEAVAEQLAMGISHAELFEMVTHAKKAWESTFDAMSDGVFIFDKDKRLIRVNRAGAALEDASPQLLLGRHCCDILRASDSKSCVVEKIIDQGRSVTLEYTPERLQHPLLITAEPIFEGDQVAGTVCTVRDLSELRTVEAVARERQSLLVNILESAREAIYAIDLGGRFQWCNSATFALCGWRPEDLIGRSFTEIAYEPDRGLFRERFERSLEGEPQTYEIRCVSGDGQIHYVLVDNAPIVIDGRTTGVLGIARDITEQKQERERAAQADKLRALGQLASGVAHDFNNSLAAILGRAQLLRRMTLDPELSHSLEIIQTAAEDAAATVRRIRTFARQSQGEKFDLLEVGDLLRDAIEITRTRWENDARARGLSYEVRLHAPCKLYAHGSASELREVFVNLIVNAVDAMPRGGELSIRCVRAGDHLQIFFTDTGTGMEEEVRERIFEPFYTTKGAHGTGLGLFVSYGIIERHRGAITVESEVGHGTTFAIDLPAAEPARPAAGEQLRPEGKAGKQRLAVLVVDDEPYVRQTLVEMISALKHRVAAADSGRAALSALALQSFDLVFTDLSMPEMDGWEVAREIRRRWPEVRVVIVTGYGKDAAEPSGEESSADGVIGKPFDFAQVEEVIAQVSAPREVTSLD